MLARHLVVGSSRRVLRSTPYQQQFVQRSALSSLTSPSGCIIDTVTNQLSAHKSIVGNPVLIMSGSDEKSIKLRQQMWVELQQLGIQSTFSTVLSRYPTTESLDELTLMARRSNVKSIICIGDAEVTQTAAAVRQGMGLAAGQTALSMSAPAKDASSGPPLLPLLSIPTGVFPAAYYNHSQLLKTPDADVMTWLLTTPPNLVIHDKSYSATPTTDAAMNELTLFLLGDLFDTIYATVYASAASTAHIKATLIKQQLKQQSRQQPQGGGGWGASPPSSKMKGEDDWETAMHSVLSTEINALGMAEHFNFGVAGGTDQYSNLCHLSATNAMLRSRVTHRFAPLSDPLNWATPVQMRTAYELIRTVSAKEVFTTSIGARNIVKLLRFVVSERGRLINKRPDSAELIPYDTLLKSICHLIPVVSREKKSKYAHLLKHHQENSSDSLVKNDDIFADITAMIDTIAPTNDDVVSSNTGLQSYDELRLAEEINMEDQIYSDEQIKRAIQMKSMDRSDLGLGLHLSSSSSDAELDCMFGRLQFIKTDFFSDFCNSGN